MSSGRKTERLRTVKFRLTAWYLFLFTLVSAAVLWLAEARLDAILRARTDGDLREDLLEIETDYLAGGLSRLKQDFEREEKSSGREAIALALLSPDGQVLLSSDLAPWQGVELPPRGTLDLAAGEVLFATLPHPVGESSRLSGMKLADGSVLCLGQTLDEEQELTDIFRGVLLLALVGMLVSGGIMGWFITRWAMAGVGRVTRVASGMGRERLGERVDIGREGQEIAELAVAFNGMLERIDALVRSLREVTDNLAHDLRSPLTRLRGRAEGALTSDAGLPEFRDLAGDMIEESDGLVAMLDTMLEIAETDAGRARVEFSPVKVAALLEKAHDLFGPAAEDRGLRLVYEPVPDDLVVRSDLPRLQRVMANLLDNAIKYTPPGGSITLSAAPVDGRAVIRVSDTGIGIGAEDLPRVFNRFFRADSSRSQPGSGLGLSLSQALVRALDGEILVESEPGKGSGFTVFLPLSGTGAT